MNIRIIKKTFLCTFMFLMVSLWNVIYMPVCASAGQTTIMGAFNRSYKDKSDITYDGLGNYRFYACEESGTDVDALKEKLMQNGLSACKELDVKSSSKTGEMYSVNCGLYDVTDNSYVIISYDDKTDSDLLVVKMKVFYYDGTLNDNCSGWNYDEGGLAAKVKSGEKVKLFGDNITVRSYANAVNNNLINDDEYKNTPAFEKFKDTYYMISDKSEITLQDNFPANNGIEGYAITSKLWIVKRWGDIYPAKRPESEMSKLPEHETQQNIESEASVENVTKNHSVQDDVLYYIIIIAVLLVILCICGSVILVRKRSRKK